jgi:hypothetical protein
MAGIIARICAECDKEIVGRVLKGCCERCYKRQYNKTGRVVDPTTKLCTHVSVCSNKRFKGGLCSRHYNERRLELIAASEYAAAASAATAPKERRSTKAPNGKKKAKEKKPVVVKKREVDSDYDDEDESDVDY